MNYTTAQMHNILTLADNYGKQNTTCKKTAVGCYIVEESGWRRVLGKGANRGGIDCREAGCLREELFGNNSKEHRDTCRCVHSEINALSKVAEDRKVCLKGATAFVTRYPCDACAKALVEAGIKGVVYGRPFEISEATKTLFEKNEVEVIHISDWNCDENDVNN